MKKLFIALTFFTATQVFAQTLYTSVADPNHAGGIILNGTITKYALINNPAFDWYGKSAAGYQAPTAIVTAMKNSSANVKFVIFGGSWCGDTQNILPKFFKLQELSGVPDANISLMAVDRQKKTIGNLATVMGITNVPTIIVMKDGKEVGRVVEYGKTGSWDTELAALLQ